MDHMLYVAMTGAQQVMVAQAANSHNLANVSTTGFRADLNQFRSQPLFGQGLPSRVYAMSERPGVNLSPGAIQITGRDLDMAVKGDGFIAIQTPDGGEAYTRAGNFRLTSSGLLETGAGQLVLGNGGPIAIPPAEKVEVGADGTISVRPLGQAAKALAEVDRIKLVRPPLEQLVKGVDGLLHIPDAKPLEPDAEVRLVSGALEASNVNGVEAMVKMIDLARKFELQVKMMRIAEENAEVTTQIMRIS